MAIFYRFITNLLYPFLIVLIYLRTIINKEDKMRFKEKLFISNFNFQRNLNSKLIWFHAASVGEFKSIFPLINKLNDEKENLEFLITTQTLSSSNLVKKETKNFNNLHHRFLPLDINHLAENFLKGWKPDRILFVDSEIWPNFIHSIKKLKIPFALVNGRLTSKSFKKWIKLPKFSRSLFSTFDLCLTSNLQTKKYLSDLGADNISYVGNLKLINSVESEKKNDTIENFLRNNIFWLAASTHPGEEEFCLKTHLKLKKIFPNVKTILAPRHIHRSSQIQKLCERLNFKSNIIKENEKLEERYEIFILNSFGILSMYFKHAKAVFIGKSLDKKFKNEGGQNPIEAARFGCKIYHGNYVYNFEEIYNILNQKNIARVIESSDELSNNLEKDLQKGEKDYKEFVSFMNKLSNQTLRNTMEKLNQFI